MSHRIMPNPALLVLAILAALLLFGCGNPRPSLSACEAALRQQLATAMADPSAPEGKRPAACEGIGDADLQRLAGEVMATAIPSS